MRRRLGDTLLDQGLLTEEELATALEEQLRTGERLGRTLVRLALLSESEVADALSKHLGIKRVDFSELYLSAEVVDLVPATFIMTRHVLPLEVQNGSLLVAMVDPLDITVIDDLQRLTGKMVQPVVATEEEIIDAFQRTRNISQSARELISRYKEEEAVAQEMDRLEYLGDAPGVKLANLILEQAIKQKASDVHFEPHERGMRVRYRIDGLLRSITEIPRHLRNDVNSRVKIMAGMDITERRKPQDGRIQMTADRVEVDMRVSSLPTVHGEKIVARILQKSSSLVKLEDFGFSPLDQRRIRRMLQLNQGLLLVTGPTGSGKSTTLFSFLNSLNSPEKNIVTVEDPVEYRLDGVNHVQVNPKVGLTFATGLRTVLRQDPDVIMVGEIRDEETGEIAVRSALTGHLVLSTLHTNSAVATISRLLNMNMESYILSSTIIGIVAQRLVRTICPDCKEPVELTDPVMLRYIESLGIEVPKTVYRGAGCPICKNTGYRGRTAVAEVLVFNKEMRDAVERSASEAELWDIALRAGMKTLQRAAIDKLIEGVTTPEEIIRTVYSVDMEEDE
ncbi:MAG TPA: Flp pilus assembly complex ATPase component TadA [Firmicutes bacterium]|nr:Flp pilus assembly complex ATPase component TadA [Bacillota bacterium]